MQKLKQVWLDFVQKNPKLSEWIREGGLYLIVSNMICITRGFMISILEIVFAFLGNEAIGFPNIRLNILGIEFDWYIIGANKDQGGVASFTALIVSLWVCEIVSFYLQRNLVFRSEGKIGRQVALYFSTFLIVTCIANGFNNIWVNVAIHFVSPIVYNLGTTFLTGGIALLVFFFVNGFIFKEKND